MNVDQDSASSMLANWAADLRYEDLPHAVRHHVKRFLLDLMGVTIAGSTTDLARATLDYVKATEAPGAASVIGTDFKMSPAGAVIANGTAASVLELDDGHAHATIHPGATCIPAILAMAEAQGASSREVILAIAVAYEVSARLGAAVCKGSSGRGFHCTPMVGVLGAAAGVSKILGNDATATAYALGIAGSNAGGLFDYHGGWLNAWCINAGRVGREGLLSASLPRYGVAGPLDIFDGPKGFFAAFAGAPLDRDAFLRSLGREWTLLDTAMKIYPCCRRLHPVIDAIVALKAQGMADGEAVDHILIETSPESARLDRLTFDSVSAAQMSLPYGAAVALVHGEPNLGHFEEEARGDPMLRRLAEMVELAISGDPEIVDPTRFAARVSLTAGGRTSSITVTTPKGDPANPVDDRVLEDKFRGLAVPVIGSERAERVIAAIWSLDRAEEGPDRKLDFLANLAC